MRLDRKVATWLELECWIKLNVESAEYVNFVELGHHWLDPDELTLLGLAYDDRKVETFPENCKMYSKQWLADYISVKASYDLSESWLGLLDESTTHAIIFEDDDGSITTMEIPNVSILALQNTLYELKV